MKSIIVLFFALSVTFCSAQIERASIELKSTELDSGNVLVSKKIKNNGVLLFVLIEERNSLSDEIVSTMEMYFFDGKGVAVSYWNHAENVKYVESKHGATVACRFEDNDADGLIDRVAFMNDDSDRDFFFNQPKAFFRSKELGMIPVVETIVDHNGVAYRVDRGTETLMRVEE